MTEINDEFLPEIIERRELNFSFQEKYCKRVEELLEHDERLPKKWVKEFPRYLKSATAKKICVRSSKR